MSMEWRKSTRSGGVEDHACVEVTLVPREAPGVDGQTFDVLPSAEQNAR